MKTHLIDIEQEKQALKDVMVKCSNSYIKLESFNSHIALDIWYYRGGEVTIDFGTQFKGKILEKLLICAQNDLRINFKNVETIQFKNLIVEAPGFILETDKKFDNIYAFIFGTKIKLPDNAAEEIFIEKIKNKDEEELREKLTSFALIPGCGEFALDPQLSRALGAKESIKEIKQTFPNIEWVSVVVSWFGTDLDIKECKIKPGYDRFETRLDSWSVGNWQIDSISEHNKALKISLETGNMSRYGGTTNDKSVLAYLDLLKSHNIKIAFYPFFMMDIIGKPWRGHLSGNPSDVNQFTEEQYIPFIKHYTQLVKGKVDAFIIGSELVSLTKIVDNEGRFPFVKQLIDLSTSCKDILGKDVIITYAANWSEYHTVDGISRPLDELWAHNAIDVVGIDAYFPLTDSTDIRISRKDIYQKWTSGEGWDYYISNGTLIKFNQNEPWNIWKNIKYWWESEHWVGSEKTNWQPKMKPIWFTEFGFASIDKASNEPNVFFDEFSTVDGGIPKHSEGRADFAIQRESILATLDFLKDNPFIKNAFYWCWDARGLGWQYDKYFADGCNWKLGHWIDGKVGNMQPLYIESTIQKNLQVSSFTDIDLIPSINVSGILAIKAAGSIKIRDDLVLGNWYPNHIGHQWQLHNQYLVKKDEYLAKFDGKSFIRAEHPFLSAKGSFFIITKQGRIDGEDYVKLQKQFYSEDFIHHFEEIQEIGLMGE